MQREVKEKEMQNRKNQSRSGCQPGARQIEYAMLFEVKSTAGTEKRRQHRADTAGEQPSLNKKTTQRVNT